MTSTRIRAVTNQDAAAIAALFADESIAQWTDELPFHSAQEWATKIESAQKAGAFAWVYERNGEVLGCIKLTSITFPRRKHVAQLGPMLVAKSAQRQGVGAQLLQHALNACDNWLQVRRIESLTDADNEAAKALLRKQGFVAETSSKAYRSRGGRFVDGVGLARLNEGVMPAPSAPSIPDVGKASIDIARVEIRPAEPSDAEGVNNIFLTESASMGTLQSPYTAANTRTVYLTNPPPGRYPLVAVYEGKIIGSAGISPVREGKCYQHVGYLGLGVHEAYQGAGVGRKLMQALVDIGDRWANYPRLDLSVFNDNPRAVALYESLGFKREGILKQHAFRGGGYADSLAMGRVR